MDTNDRGQLMLLTAFLMAVGLVIIIILANNVLYGLNLPGLINPQERVRIESSISIFEDQVDELGNYFAQNNEISEENASEMLRNQMLNVSDLFEDIYASHGIALNVDVDTSKTRVERKLITGDSYRRGAAVNVENHTFPKQSLVIAVDDNQWFLNDSDNSNDKRIMKVFGLIYRTLNDRNENSSQLDNSKIPVYRILESPNGITSDIPQEVTLEVSMVVNGTGGPKNVMGDLSFSGGPFIINNSSISAQQKNYILSEAQNLSLDVYALNESFTYNSTTKMVGAPRVAIYPQSWHSGTQNYFQLAGLTDSEYTLLNTTEIEQGALNNADILFVPHDDPTDSLDPYANLTSTAANNILQWVSRGGVYYTECYGTETIDDVIEQADMNLHPWYGFIGVNKSSDIGANNNGTIQDNIFNSNTTLFASQTYTPDGEIYQMDGKTPSFTFRSDKNPQTVPLINASDGSTATVLAYAPFDNGHVIYFGGHDQTERESVSETTPERAALVTDALLLSNTTKIVPIYKIYFNASLNYSDGSTNFYKELNISVTKTPLNATKEIISGISNSNLEVNFVYPKDGYVLEKNISVQVSGNGSDTYFKMDDLSWVAMNDVGNNLWNTTINTSDYSDGEHIFAVKTVNDSSFAYESVSVTFDNGGGSEPGVGAEWEGNKDVEDNYEQSQIEIQLEVWKDKDGENDPLSDAEVNLSIKRKAPEELLYTNIIGITDNGTLEGEIQEDDSDDAVWYLITGADDSDDDKNLGSWEFKKNKKYVVIAEVKKNGKSQYFEEDFQF